MKYQTPVIYTVNEEAFQKEVKSYADSLGEGCCMYYGIWSGHDYMCNNGGSATWCQFFSF